MNLSNVIVDCQVPPDGWNIKRRHRLVQCTIDKNSEEYNVLLDRAKRLASMVNHATANNADIERNLQRREIDAFGGLLAESGWEQYINSKFDHIASPTPFTDASIQIDIELSNKERIEVRSSFPRNGVKFGICNDHYNFRNIGPYSNSIKPNEIQKNLYLAVLFDTKKNDLLTADTITFSLIGGSTWEKLINDGYNADLVPENDSFAHRSNYRVINLKDTFDVGNILEEIERLGYNRI